MVIRRDMCTAPECLTLEAPAKVNLYLEILGRRPNGYHDIRSVIAPISLCDTVTIERQPSGIESSYENGELPEGSGLELLCDKDNLVTRAAFALLEATGHAGGARIHLHKRIPVGGGLGGGSADAAAVLLGLNELWGLNLPCSQLMEIGSRVGCDVPAVVHGGAVCVEGLGERVSGIPVAEPVAGNGWWLVLVNPGVNVSTRDIYSRLGTFLTPGGQGYKNTIFGLKEGRLDLVAQGLFNGLEATVFRKYPLIALVANSLRDAGSPGVLLCGSGGSVFGLASDEGHARVMADGVGRAVGAPLWARTVRLLPDGVMVAHGPLEARV